MQVVVHRLGLRQVFVTEARVRGFGPIALPHFPVAAVDRVERVALQQSKQLPCLIQGRLMMESLCEFGQGIDIKRLSVAFLGILENLAGIVEPPERAAVARIPEPVHHISQGSPRHLAIGRLRSLAIYGRKRPQNAAMHDQPFRLGAVDLQIVRHPGHPAAMLVVDRRTGPKRQDMAEELGFDPAGEVIE